MHGAAPPQNYLVQNTRSATFDKPYLLLFLWYCLISYSFPQSHSPQGAWHCEQPCGASVPDLWAARNCSWHWWCSAALSCKPLCSWHVGMVTGHWEILSKFISFVYISDSAQSTPKKSLISIFTRLENYIVWVCSFLFLNLDSFYLLF
jgi:hypothetical protein